MILKYRGYNYNWCFVEGSSITTAKISTEDIKDSVPYSPLTDRYKTLEDRIAFETKIDRLHFIGEVFSSSTVVVVSIGTGVGYSDGYVLVDEAYLLNDNGKTIERLI